MQFGYDWRPEQVEVTITFPCPDCGGTGETKAERTCPRCLGKRVMREAVNVRELLLALGVAFQPEPEDH